MRFLSRSCLVPISPASTPLSISYPLIIATASHPAAALICINSRRRCTSPPILPRNRVSISPLQFVAVSPMTKRRYAEFQLPLRLPQRPRPSCDLRCERVQPDLRALESCPDSSTDRTPPRHPFQR